MTYNAFKETRFVHILQYPGAVLLTRKIDTEEHVQKIVNKVVGAWPIIFVYFILTLLTAVLLLVLVSCYIRSHIHFLI